MSKKPVIISIDTLNKAGLKGPITMSVLIEKGLILKAEAQRQGVKILGGNLGVKSHEIIITQEDSKDASVQLLTVSKSLQEKLVK